MLEQVLDYIHNYFVYKEYSDTFVIRDGRLVGDSDFLLGGQYFKIDGSILNDGIYKYPDYELSDETFTGTVSSLAIPPALISTVSDIENWVNKYGSVTDSPYSSESFGGYSYTKSSQSGSSGGISWKDMFGSRLNRWRKIS